MNRPASVIHRYDEAAGLLRDVVASAPLAKTRQGAQERRPAMETMNRLASFVTW